MERIVQILCITLLFVGGCEPDSMAFEEFDEFREFEEEEESMSTRALAPQTLECNEFYPNVSGETVKADVTATGTGVADDRRPAAEAAYMDCVAKILNRSDLNASWDHNGQSMGPGDWTCDNSGCPNPIDQTCGSYWFYTDGGNTIRPSGRPDCTVEYWGSGIFRYTCEISCEVQVGIQWGCTHCKGSSVGCKSDDGPGGRPPSDDEDVPFALYESLN